MNKDNKSFLIAAVAICAFFAVNLLVPVSEAGLTVEGRFWLGAIAMCLCVWLTGALHTAVSSIMIAVVCLVSMPFFVGVSVTEAYKTVLAGFASTTFCTLLGAFIMVAGITKSGLGNRIGMLLLKVVGPKPKRLMIGIFIGFPLINLFIPSVQAVTTVMMAVLAGIVADYSMDLKSNVTKSLYMTLAMAALPCTTFIQTAGAAAIRCNAILAETFGTTFTYLEFLINGLPIPIFSGIICFFLIGRMFPMEFKEFPGGKAHIDERVTALGKWSRDEKVAAITCAGALFLWITNGTLTNVETGVVALIAGFIMLIPKVGVIDWPYAGPRINWPILLLTGISTCVATGLYSSGAIKLLVNYLLENTPLATFPLPVIVLLGLLAGALAAVCFSARASAVLALMPVFCGFAIAVAELHGGTFDPRGMAMVLYYPIILSVMLPVHTPFILMAFGSNTFEEKDFRKLCLVYVPAMMLLLAVCFFTYWQWIGLV